MTEIVGCKKVYMNDTLLTFTFIDNLGLFSVPNHYKPSYIEINVHVNRHHINRLSCHQMFVDISTCSHCALEPWKAKHVNKDQESITTQCVGIVWFKTQYEHSQFKYTKDLGPVTQSFKANWLIDRLYILGKKSNQLLNYLSKYCRAPILGQVLDKIWKRDNLIFPSCNFLKTHTSTGTCIYTFS